MAFIRVTKFRFVTFASLIIISVNNHARSRFSRVLYDDILRLICAKVASFGGVAVISVPMLNVGLSKSLLTAFRGFVVGVAKLGVSDRIIRLFYTEYGV